MKEFIVKENEQQRLIKLLGKILVNADNGFIYKMLRKKNIVLNDKKASGNESLKAGDSIKIYFSDETFDKLSSSEVTFSLDMSKDNKGFSIKDNIIYENEDVIFINKPVGVLSQKAKKEDVSIIEYLIQYMLDEGGLTQKDLATFKPAVCNRLDRNTSGIILAGKSLKGLRVLSDIIAKRELDKFYLTIVKGEVTKPIKSEALLYKDEKNNRVRVFDNVNKARDVIKDAKELDKLQKIKTNIKPLLSHQGYTLLEVELITGKSHQIRATMEHLGYPVYGDEKYGSHTGVNDAKNKAYVDQKGKTHKSYQMLHAYKVCFKCDSKEYISNETDSRDLKLDGKSFVCNPPKEFMDILLKLGFKEEKVWDIIKEGA